MSIHGIADPGWGFAFSGISLFSVFLIVFVALTIYHEARTARRLGAGEDEIATLRLETIGLHVLHGMSTILLFAVGIHFIVRRRVTTPIAQMVLAGQHFRMGTWSPRFPCGGRDEIAWLAANLRELGPHLERTIMSFIEADRKSVVSRISLACDKHLMPPARRIQSLAQTMNSVSGNDWAWIEVEEAMTKVVNALDLLRDPEGAACAISPIWNRSQVLP